MAFNNKKMSKSSSNKFAATLGSGFLTFAVLWVLAGLAALVMSIYCWAAYPNAEPSVDILAVLLAIVLGPFYWIFYFYKSGYCGRAQ
jgi:hypothetical protein